MGLPSSDNKQSTPGPSPPEDFLEVRRPGLLVWVRKGFSFLLDEGGVWSKDRAFRPADEVSPYSGRGELLRLSLGPMGDSCALVRHYQRGGVFGQLLRDFYLGRRRFLQEVRVSEWARDQDIPTAEVLALRIEQKGLCLYRGDLVTREIEASEDLDEYLKSARTGGGWTVGQGKEIIRSVALLLQRMHRAGLYHADLNLKNILVQITECGVNSYVIDLDRARVIKPLGSRMRIRNLVRLYRSMDKQGYLKDLIGMKDIVAFVRAYCGEDLELLTVCKEVMRKDMWLLRYHRAGWRLSRGLRKIGRGGDD
jgi:tRNA A-37 threonylcarbamoyl transferase component Bud32